jgi:uncharacterized protein (TIGR02145 family)
MRKLYSLLIAGLLTSSTIAQSPQKMSFQAVIRNSTNQLVINHAVGMRISILQGSSTGTAVYVETHTPVSNSNGLVTIEIGGGTPVTGTFAGIDWSTGTYFIKTETDLSGGTGYTITGTSQILSVPYALYAKTSESSADAVKLTGNQTIAGNKTFSGTTTVITPVNENDAVTKAYVDKMLSIIQTIQTGIRDIDGNTYKVILIGNQFWMSENLKTTKYNDGTPIPNITDNTAWGALTTGAYSDYNNTPGNSTIYGRLYNWFAIDNNAGTKVASNGGKNVCPTGWHIPNDAEWTTLTDYLTNNGYGYGGSGNDIGKSMANTSGWTLSYSAGTVGTDQASNNSSGFTALPGGGRGSDATYHSLGLYGFWWSSTDGSSTYAHYQYIHHYNSTVVSANGGKTAGFSVRCLRD